MHKDTGEILSYDDIPKEEKENYIPLTMREAKYLVKRKPDARKN